MNTYFYLMSAWVNDLETAIAERWSIRWRGLWFYLSFGIVITFSVPIAGVLLVFSFLVIAATIAFQFMWRKGALAIIPWLARAAASATGLLISFRYDLPTGPIVVCMFGVLLLLAYGLRRVTGFGHALAEPEVSEAA